MSIWVYSYNPRGAVAYSIDNGYVYKKDLGKAIYFIQEGWWYTVDGGTPSFYVDDNTVDGKPAYYFNN